MVATLTTEANLAELNQKLDRLVTQVEFLTEEAHRQKRRQQAQRTSGCCSRSSSGLR